jgi:hypothetical protein
MKCSADLAVHPQQRKLNNVWFLGALWQHCALVQANTATKNDTSGNCFHCDHQA